MRDEKKLTAAEKKHLESVDNQIGKLQDKIAVNRKEYDTLTEELQQLLEEKYPERKTERIKNRFYEAYSHSNRSLDEIIAFMEGRDDVKRELHWFQLISRKHANSKS